MVFMKRQRMKDLLLRALIVVETSKNKIWRRHLADNVKKIAQKSVPHMQHNIIFPHSSNQIIDLWQCRGHCHGHFFKTPYC